MSDQKKSFENVTRLVTTARKSAELMRTSVQKAAVAILLHAYKYGDYTMAEALVEACGDGVRGDALVTFFAKCGGLKVDEENNTFCGWKGRDHIKAHMELAKEKPWYLYKKANPFKGYDVNQALAQLEKKFNKMKKDVDGMEEGDKEKVNLVIDEAILKRIMSMANFEAIIPVDDVAGNDDALIAELEKQAG